MSNSNKPSKNKKWLIWASAATFALALLTVFTLASLTNCLQLRDLNSGKIVWRGQLADQETFSVSYTHSVNKSDVNEEYQLRQDDFYLIRLYYSAFGAGMTTDIYADGGLSISYQDGKMIVEFDKLLDDITYSVARTADLILHYRGEQIHFIDLAEPGELLHFETGLYPAWLL